MMDRRNGQRRADAPRRTREDRRGATRTSLDRREKPERRNGKDRRVTV